MTNPKQRGAVLRDDLIAGVTTGAVFGPFLTAAFGHTSWLLLTLSVPAGALVGCLTTGLTLVARRRKRVVRVGADRGGHVGRITGDREAA